MISLLLTLACSSPMMPKAQESVVTPAARAPASPELKAHMQGHLSAVNQVREALVRGNLPAAKAANRAFLDHKVAFDLPGDWLDHVTAMGKAAVDLDAAPNIAQASQGAAQVAAACGGCHREVDARVEIPLAEETQGHAAEASRELQSLWLSLITLDRSATEKPGQAAEALTACAACHMNPPAP